MGSGDPPDGPRQGLRELRGLPKFGEGKPVFLRKGKTDLQLGDRRPETGDTYEAWAKFPQLPKINGENLNLNPENTYDSPYLKMKHGTDKAVISNRGYEDVVLDFDQSK